VIENPTLLNSFATAFSIPIEVKRQGRIAFIKGFISRASNPAQGTIICNLSQGFRPAGIIFLPCQDSSNFYQGRIDIQPNGDIQYQFGNCVSYLGINTTYVLF
jgi:hypothetical protein